MLTPRTIDDADSTIVAYDFGAHLASWEVDGAPIVWCSPTAKLDGFASIRGGVPICFPWFAQGPQGDLSPTHGPVRITPWRPCEPAGGELLAWQLSSTELAGAPGAEHLPGPFELRYAVSLTPAATPLLHVALDITNPAQEALTVEAALHTYLAVADVRTLRIRGLEGADYFDKVLRTRRTQEGDLVPTGETDRVYDRSAEVVVVDPGHCRELVLEPTGATQTVVWNPGEEKGSALADVGPEHWHRFVCVETAASAEHALRIGPGESRTIGCTISARPAASV